MLNVLSVLQASIGDLNRVKNALPGNIPVETEAIFEVES